VTAAARSPWQVTRSVWSALFIREFLARVMADRMAWFWMLAEPVAFVAIMVAIRTVVLGRDVQIAGAEFVPWIIVGLLGFFLFREQMFRAIGAVDANAGLYTYRQVKPVDPVLTRSWLEGVLRTVVLLLFIGAGVLLHIDLVPRAPLAALWAWLSLWALGLGMGLTLSALSALVPEIGRIVRILSVPLLIISGVIFPLNFLPHDILAWLMINPIVHGLEALRDGFFSVYYPLPGASLLYLWYWALALLALGLMLHLRFEMRLKAR
jgi:capsular polysaccharide transport system permease protein